MSINARLVSESFTFRVSSVVADSARDPSLHCFESMVYDPTTGRTKKAINVRSTGQSWTLGARGTSPEDEVGENQND